MAGRRLTSHDRSLTLIELIISCVVFSLIALGFYSVDLFSRNQVLSGERQAQVQQEVSIALDHITRQLTRAIGSMAPALGTNPIDQTAIGGDPAVRIFVDGNANGIRDGGDFWVAYRYSGAGAPVANRYKIFFYPVYNNPGDFNEPIARGISTFTFTPTPNSNFVTVTITGYWDPSGAAGPLASTRNPQVIMRACIKMPSVSAN